MHYLKKSIAILIALLVPFAATATANAANETVEAYSEITPRGKTFFKESSVPANLKVRADVYTPNTSPLSMPLKNVKVTFPAGTSFKPNNKKTPVCTDQQLNADSGLNKPAEVVAACEKSVVGTGTATIIFAKQHLVPHFNITDPVLVAFNGGTDNKGNVKVKIWGYSDYTKVGILMNGVMKKNVLDIAVPVLSNDSAVKNFQLELPGPRLERPELGINVQGLDPNYAQGMCPTGNQKTNAVFQLGERDFATKQPIGETVTVAAPETNKPCTGAAGAAKLGGVKVKGPNAVKRGKKGTFRVTVKNNGTATAKKVMITTNRGGKANAGNIAPGATKTVAVKVTIKGKKNRQVAVKFTAKSGKTKAGANKKVRVK